MGQLFNLILIYPIVNLLVVIFHGLTALHVPSAFGFSIIVMTVLIRLIIYPLTAQQLRASQKMQKINPHLSKLKEKHKGDAKALQQATMDLYKEHGVNPAAGCVLALVQLPILLGLYSVFQNLIHLKAVDSLNYINKIVYFPSLKLTHPWDMNFFGLPLQSSPEQLMKTFGLLILVIPLLTAVLQFFQSRMMLATTPKPEKPKDKSAEPDFASAMQTQTMYFVPLMLGYVSWRFALGLSLYWNTFSIFGMIQQYLIQQENKQVSVTPAPVATPSPIKPKKHKNKKK